MSATIKRAYNKHGMTNSIEYSCWQSMIDRCYNTGATAYYNYGGKGITVCKRWMGNNGFINFYNDMGPRPSLDHSLDRFPDFNGNYTPKNTRWATRNQQMRNRADTVMITHNGLTMARADWADHLKISYSTFCNRFKLRGSIEAVINFESRPFLPVTKYYTLNGETLCLTDWSKKLGICLASLNKRLKEWSVERALTEPKRKKHDK